VHKRWIALFAAGAAVATLTVPALSADAHRASTATYDVSLTGSQVSVVTRAGTSTDEFGCTVRHADRDRQIVSFSSRRRATLALSATRLAFIRFDLKARVSGTFHRETSSAGSGGDCVSAPTKTNRSCGPARARARLAFHPKPNLRVQFDGAFVRASDRTRCATTLTTPDAFIVPTENGLKRSPVGAGRIFLHGHLVQRTPSAQSITKTTTVDWRLVLTRTA
jgi:hypothetical protein